MSRFSFAAPWTRHFDWLLLAAVLTLSLVGLTSIYSVDLSRGEGLNFFSTQTLALVIALAGLLVAGALHITWYESGARFLYLGAIILLAGVLIFGETIRGTTGWFRLGTFSFQPAELSKAAVVIFLAWRIERQGRQFGRLQFVAATGTLALIPCLLILAQPDLGSAAVLAGIWFGLMLVVGTRRRYILGLAAAILFALAAGWLFLFQDYQKERLLTFIDPGRDPLGAGYNVQQSLIAVGAGQFFGRGLGFGSQSQLHFLPEAQTDFIISVIGEELGFVGLLIILGLYVVIIYRLIRIAAGCRTDFAAYTVLGTALLFFIQLTVNAGAALGLLPVTGVTLPFVSYGGSSLLVTMMALGLLESIAIHR